MLRVELREHRRWSRRRGRSNGSDSGQIRRQRKRPCGRRPGLRRRRCPGSPGLAPRGHACAGMEASPVPGVGPLGVRGDARRVVGVAAATVCCRGKWHRESFSRSCRRPLQRRERGNLSDATLPRPRKNAVDAQVGGEKVVVAVAVAVVVLCGCCLKGRCCRGRGRGRRGRRGRRGGVKGVCGSPSAVVPPLVH